MNEKRSLISPEEREIEDSKIWADRAVAELSRLLGGQTGIEANDITRGPIKKAREALEAAERLSADVVESRSLFESLTSQAEE